ncbi:potassium channel family protein [Gimesia chilikensis]|uniref:Voltage-gated potassium channel n=1 Tax=Gimesia chilikensis TaxID=2605989 RepID=A0A517WDI7_9PLAN|nr:potassium channel family protein [Gimesia chilikensis]KAA0139117.1 two pore domain potassium channel family protein [Gimesia chilikensis]QDU03321.1 voltage-gated potassium channel [Gimesia chilikensis]
MLKHIIEKRLPLFVEFFSSFMRYASYVREVIVALLLILLLGAFLIWRFENLSFGDAVYFSMITGLTIGYGDITPETPMGKIISVGIGLVGMIVVGLVIAIATRSLHETAKRHMDLEHEASGSEHHKST